MNRTASRTAARLLHILPRERITRALGALTDARVPRPLLRRVLGLYTRAYDVDMSEAVEPEGGYATFNEFFTRKLRDGTRPVNDAPGAVVSPADGRLDDGGPIDRDHTFEVKGQRYDAAGLVGSRQDAARFVGGSYFVVYLSPRDYHRVHAPCAMRVRRVRHIPGVLFPVNRVGIEHVPQLFVRNERVAVLGDGPGGSSVAVVLVGAMVVGKITLAIDAPARPPIGGPLAEKSFPGGGPVLERGDEVGAFQLGSTVVVLLSPGEGGAGSVLDARRGSSVRMGERVADRGPVG